MAGHLLSVLEPPVVLQVNRDPGCPPSMASDGGQKTRRFGPLPDRSPGIVSDAKLFANRSALFANDAESAMIACSLL